MDEYLIRIDGTLWLETDNASEEAATEKFGELMMDTDWRKHMVEVFRLNIRDGTLRDVTGDFVDAAFPKWDKEADEDAPMPYTFDFFWLEREPRTDNREHRTYTVKGGYPAA